MTEYTELIKALLSASTVSTAWEKLMHDAADAIEALQAQLPKRGEWIHGKELSRAYIGNCCVGIDYEDFRCSACGAVVEVCEKPKWNYCPNCGAKMEVQDG